MPFVDASMPSTSDASFTASSVPTSDLALSMLRIASIFSVFVIASTAGFAGIVVNSLRRSPVPPVAPTNSIVLPSFSDTNFTRSLRSAWLTWKPFTDRCSPAAPLIVTDASLSAASPCDHCDCVSSNTVILKSTGMLPFRWLL